MLGRLAKTAIQARKQNKRRQARKTKTPDRRRRKEEDDSSTAGDSSEAESFRSSKSKKKKSKSKSKSKSRNKSTRKERSTRNSDDPVPSNSRTLQAASRFKRALLTNNTTNTTSNTTSEFDNTFTPDVSTLSNTNITERPTSFNSTTTERPRSLRTTAPAQRSWHGAIDDEEKKYLSLLAEPRNRRADIARMREGRPAEFGDQAILDKTSAAATTSGTANQDSSHFVKSNQNDLLIYVDTEQKHYQELWNYLTSNNKIIKQSMDATNKASHQLKDLLSIQQYLIEHLKLSLEQKRADSILKFELLHDRLDYLDNIANNNKKNSFNMIDAYKAEQKKKLMEYENTFDENITNLFDHARILRDDTITNPSLEYVKKRMLETQQQHDLAYRKSILVRGTLCGSVVFLRMVLIFLKLLSPIFIGFNWCSCQNTKEEDDDGNETTETKACHIRLTISLTDYLDSLETYRKDSWQENVDVKMS